VCVRSVCRSAPQCCSHEPLLASFGAVAQDMPQSGARHDFSKWHITFGPDNSITSCTSRTSSTRSISSTSSTSSTSSIISTSSNSSTTSATRSTSCADFCLMIVDYMFDDV
jgi:hypothetical protein